MKNIRLILLVFTLLSFTLGGCFLMDEPTEPSPVPLNPADSAKWGDPMRVLWKTPRTPQKYEDFSRETAPAIVDDKIIFAYGNIIQCFSKETGDSLWAYESKSVYFPDVSLGQSAEELIVENGLLYYVSSQFAECRNVSDGSLVWRTDFERLILNEFFNRNSQSADKLFITVSGGGGDFMQLLAISKSSGSIVWRVENASASDMERTARRLGPATYHNGKVYVGSGLRLALGGTTNYYEGGISAFDTQSGAVIWKKIFPAPDSTVIDFPFWREPSSNEAYSSIHAVNDGLILQVGEGIVKLDFDGNIQWRRVVYFSHHPYAAFPSTSLMHNGIMYTYNNGEFIYQGANAPNTGDDRGYAYAIDPATSNVVWKNYVLKNGEYTSIQSSNPQISDNALYNVVGHHWLVGQDLNSGNNIWSSWLEVADSDTNRIAAGYRGAYRVERKRVYFVSTKNIVCMERK